MEKLLSADALRRNGGNHRETARELGINPGTVLREVKVLKPARSG
ncbi:MAG TPA: helix-turn-helix domain-containing protein [Candidatus Paceibacterota bacterium]|nr:helix-turn-helix domain-containing protein [Verrucomicrobiota bacterium]HSA11462.1 helix-turn-helix domain-containing protein [Candidatus Paceibacterota bacterium]